MKFVRMKWCRKDAGRVARIAAIFETSHSDLSRPWLADSGNERLKSSKPCPSIIARWLQTSPECFALCPVTTLPGTKKLKSEVGSVQVRLAPARSSWLESLAWLEVHLPALLAHYECSTASVPTLPLPTSQIELTRLELESHRDGYKYGLLCGLKTYCFLDKNAHRSLSK
jgi:hypothetical protein